MSKLCTQTTVGQEVSCKYCHGLFLKTGQNHIFCGPICQQDNEKGRWKRYGKTYRTKHPERYILNIARNRSKKYGYEFNLEESDIVLPKVCPVLKTPLIISSSTRGNPNSASIDRIDNTKGYVKGNIQIMSLLANQMKSSATPEQLRMFADWVICNV